MKKFKQFVFTFLFLLSLQGYSQICSEHTNVNGNAGTGFSNGIIGQSFTACETGRLRSVKVESGNSGSGFNNVVVEIRSGDGFAGTVLGTSGAVNVRSNRTTTWDLTSLGISVVTGQKYTARFITQSGTPQMAYSTSPNPSNDYYPGGRIHGAGQAHNDMFFTASVDYITYTLDPADQSTDVSRIADIALIYSRSMAALTGDVEFNNLSNASSELIPAEDLEIDGATVIIPYSGILESNTNYEVIVPSTVIESSDGLSVDGIATGEWTFTTGSTAVPELTSAENTITNESTFSVSIDFSEAVTGFDVSDLSLTNCTAANFTGSGTSYSVDISPSADGDVVVDLPADVTVEGNEAASYTILFDSTSPTVTLSSSVSGTISSAPFDVTVQFSEAVSGFDGSLANITNGTVLSTEIISDLEYELSIDVLDEGTVTVEYPAGLVTDEAGNSNLLSNSLSFNYEVDLETGAISFFPLNDVLFDVLGNNEDLGGNLSATDDRHGQPNGALTFGSSFLASNFDNTPAGDGMGVSVWLRPAVEMNQNSALQYIYRHATFSLYYEEGVFYASLNTDVYSQAINLPAGEYSHIVLTASYNGQVSLYVNETRYDIGTAPANIFNQLTGFTLGAASSGNLIFNGDIDEFRYWEKALLTPDVSALYNEPQYLLENLQEEICGDIVYTTTNGDELSVSGNYFYIEESQDASPDSFVTLQLEVLPVPTVVATADALLICEGEEVTLTGEGAESYSWDNGAVDGEPISVSSTTTFTVTGTGANGCENTDEVTVEVIPLGFEDVEVTSSTSEFCPDGSAFTGTISIANSSTGIDYYLRNSADNSIVDGPVAGTGSALDFTVGSLAETTTFNVLGENPSEASNHSLEFDGSDDQVDVPINASFTYESGYTLEAWVKAPHPGAASHRPLMSIGNASSTDIDIYIQKNTNRLVVFQERDAAGHGGFSYEVPPNNVWFHLAVTFDGVNYKVYYDGVQQAIIDDFSPSGPLVRSSGMNFRLGKVDHTAFGANGAFFEGTMDEVRLWNGARSEEELNELMTACLEGTEAGLEYYFPMDDGTGTTITDMVGSSDATMVNMDANTAWLDGYEGLNCLKYVSCSMQLSQEVTIGDMTAPTLVLATTTLQHPGTGDLEITIDDLNNGSSDNCTADEDILYTISPNTFACDASGDITVTVTAEDEAGNVTEDDVIVTLIPAITDQTVSAGQTDFCIDGVSETTVQLDGSDVGINYYLRDGNNAIIDGPFVGDGGPVTFSTGILTETSTFNVLGTTDQIGEDFAATFSGSRIEIPNSPSLQMQSQWTLEVWVKPQTPHLHIIETYDASGGFILRTHTSGLIQAYAMASETAFNIGASNTPLTIDEWNHVAVTFDEDIDEMNIYINGQLDKTITGMTVDQQGSNTTIKIAARGDDEAMIGEQILDEVRIWDVARSAADIAASMNSCLVGDEEGLVLYYDFKDLDITASGMTVTDKSTSGNDGTFEGAYETSDFVDPVSTSCTSGAECSLQMSTEVTIGDTTPPDVVTQNISVTLDPNTLTASVLPEDLDAGSTDDCTDDESLTFSLSQSDFTCDHLGENTVSLIVSDDQGNTAEANATITVSLTLATEDITAELDADGNVTIDPGSLYAGPVLICNEEIVVTVDQTTFSCADLGANEVTVSTDVNGTTVSSTAIVTVVDNVAPAMLAQDIVVNLDATGQATIEAADLDNGSTDNCTAAESLIFSVTQETFDCADVDANDQKTNNGVAVDLTIEDENGNSTTSTVFVTVLDTISPMAFAQDISVRLDENNSAVIDATMVDNGSSDNCGISSFSLSQTAFNDSHIGTNTVTLTAVDASGNVGTATATVTVDPYKQTQAITFESIPDKTYGDEDFTLSATSDASLSVSFSVVSGPVSVSGNTVTITGAGQAVIEARQEGNEDFLAAEPAQQSFDISTAVLEVLADDQTITYGDNLPTFSVSYNGFVNGESEADLDTAPSASTTATAESDAGIYDITASGGVSSNYAFSYVAGILTISKASQTISIDAIEDKQPDDNPFDVVVSASSGLEVALSVTGPATISGKTITLDGTEGTVTVSASQAGNVNFESAEATITFEVQVVLGQPDAYQLKIYPNPAENILHVQGLEVLAVSIFSLDGKLQLKSTATESIDISELKSGVYLMEIKTEERVFIQRLMKN